MPEHDDVDDPAAKRFAEASAQFRANRCLAELIAEQQVSVVTDGQALAMPDWLEDETADDVITYVRAQRAADRDR